MHNDDADHSVEKQEIYSHLNKIRENNDHYNEQVDFTEFCSNALVRVSY